MDSGQKSKALLFHVAITMHGTEKWILQHSAIEEYAFRKAFEKIRDIIIYQVNNKLRIVTFYVQESKNSVMMKVMQEELDKLLKESIIADNQVKLSFVGRWYALNNEIVETIKYAIDETKDYDNFFVNFCVNYSGQDEILEAVQLIARKVKADKLDPELVTKEIIKESLFTSNMMPPDIIIRNGSGKSLEGFLMWDSAHAHIYFSGKSFIDITAADIDAAIEDRKRS